jgi:hypothetical protein
VAAAGTVRATDSSRVIRESGNGLLLFDLLTAEEVIEETTSRQAPVAV